MQANSLQKVIISLQHINTPLGVMIAGATNKGLCLLEYHDRATLPKELSDLQTLLNAEVVEKSNIYIDQAKKELHEYFAGVRKKFDVPLSTPGTEFQIRVWNKLKEIPFGETISYLEQAAAMGSIQSIRAIAHANGCNRISIIIPCHRVIGKNGNLTGYGGGIERKRFLILHENHYSMHYQSDLFSGLLNVP
ncbi:MAG TPA: methylated-DNA--[protein]-cysteine S-methyltransferase [Lentimicrobium sp.]|nr:methylated-DNA--[protein]-cysteine S-methyltransferase [Lentimicrobium sp.]